MILFSIMEAMLHFQAHQNGVILLLTFSYVFLRFLMFSYGVLWFVTEWLALCSHQKFRATCLCCAARRKGEVQKGEENQGEEIQGVRTAHTGRAGVEGEGEGERSQGV